MKKLLSLVGSALLAFGLVGTAHAVNNPVTGAGSSFIYPVLIKWATAYDSQTKNQINYQPIGSGGGIRQLSQKTVTFAASDMPLDANDLAKHGWIQFPMIVGGIVPVVHLSGVKNEQLVLNGKTLAGIYLGKIQYWDNAAIKKLNPGLTLPHNRILTIHRADGSGTTFNFTNYLSKVSPVWKSSVGSNTVVDWPGMGVGAKGNAGVASQVQTIPNSIGYVEYAYALQNHMITAKMQNSAGKVVAPSSASFTAAAANAKWLEHKDFYLILTNQPGAGSWPIVATTFIMVPTHPVDQNALKQALQFFAWSYQKGGQAATALDYVSIPKNVYTLVGKSWAHHYAFAKTVMK